MAIVRKKIKIEEFFKTLGDLGEEERALLPKDAIKIKTENGFQSIESIYKTNKRIINELILENFNIKAVPEHRVFTNNGWKYIKDLNKDQDLVMTLNGYEKILNINVLNNKENCYDFQVANTHSYFGNGILNHNTEIGISICKLTNIKTLILFARIDLAHQTKKRMIKAGLDAGIVQGNNIDENHQIVMATVQSGHKLNNLNDYDMIIIDECHRSSGDQYREILRRSSARYRLGLSATPFVKDKYKAALVRMWIGNLIYEVDPEKLLKEGRIAIPTIRMLTIKSPNNIKEARWPQAEKFGIVENSYRNRIIVNLTGMLKGKILILVKLIEHGDYLHENIPGSIWLSGKNKSKEREAAIEAFESDKESVIISSTIFDEGIDIKSVTSLILAGGGASYVKILQRIGRGLRITETKKTVDVYDFYDETNDILQKHSEERIKTYKHECYNDIRFVKEDLIEKLSEK